MADALWRLPLRLPVTCLLWGIHEPGLMKHHLDRVLDCFELIFVQDGTLAMGEEEQRFLVKKGQTLLLWPGRRHMGTAELKPDMWFYWVTFRAAPGILRRGSGRRLPTGAAGAGGPSGGLAIPQLATPAQPQRLTEMFQGLLAQQNSGLLRPEAANLALLMVLHEVSQAALPAVAPAGGGVLARRAAEHIARALDKPHQELTTSAIARALHCNADYLGRVFRLSLGQTLSAHIHRKRVDKARGLLQLGQSVEAASRACGFADSRYFRRIFRRYTGMTPRAFRAQHQLPARPRPTRYLGR